MALVQFPHILLIIPHIVYFIFDMQKEHMRLWFRIFLLFRALKTVNTNKPDVTVDFSCDPDIFLYLVNLR
jgi:hypothetical protein